jgi:predicted kinase
MKTFKQYFIEEVEGIDTQPGVQNQDQRNTLMVLVGPPSIGKSTWVEQNAPDAFIISRDDIVNEVGQKYGLTYDDMFAAPEAELPVGHVDQKYGQVVPKPQGLPPFLPDKLWSKVLDANNEVTDVFNQRFPSAVSSGKDIIVDMTNMSVGSREGILKNFGKGADNYKKVAVVFNSQGSDLQKAIKNIAARRAEEIKAQGGSKTIPDEAFNRMFASYEPPTNAEGFEEIINVDDSERILKELQ